MLASIQKELAVADMIKSIITKLWERIPGNRIGERLRFWVPFAHNSVKRNKSLQLTVDYSQLHQLNLFTSPIRMIDLCDGIASKKLLPASDNSQENQAFLRKVFENTGVANSANRKPALHALWPLQADHLSCSPTVAYRWA
jgi:hypothetical protein